MSILQGHVVETHYPPAPPNVCDAPDAYGSFTLNLNYTLGPAAREMASTSMTCSGDKAVCTYSASPYTSSPSQIFTFGKTAGTWSLINTKSIPTSTYIFPGSTGTRNNGYLQISGNGQKLFVVVYDTVQSKPKILQYTWNGTEWSNETVISAPAGIVDIGAISVSYNGKTFACNSTYSSPRKYAHLIWRNGVWEMVVQTDYLQYFITCAAAISSDGNTAAFGNSGGNISLQTDEPVKIYKRVSGTWTETASLTPPSSGVAGYSYFGASVSLDSLGAILCIGAPLYNDDGANTLEPGRAYVAYADPWTGVWDLYSTIEYPLTPSYSDWTGWFGMAVSLSSFGGRAAIMPEYGGKTSSDPIGFVFDEDGSGNWPISDSLLCSVNEKHRENSIAISGDCSSIAVALIQEPIGDSNLLLYNL